MVSVFYSLVFVVIFLLIFLKFFYHRSNGLSLLGSWDLNSSCSKFLSLAQTPRVVSVFYSLVFVVIFFFNFFIIGLMG